MSTTTDERPTADATTTELPATRPAGKAGGLTMGMAPRTIDEAWRLAQILSKSGLVPEDFRGRPENVLVALQLGSEVGFAPMQALQSIAVVNGRPSIWGDGFLALILASPKYRTHEEYFEVAGERRTGLVAEDWKRDDTAAVCTFWRTDRSTPTTGKFTVGQAKRAELLGKKGPWQTYPDRMLRMRARSWAGRDAFPDVLRGLRTTEEIIDLPADFVEVPAAAPVQPRRASERPDDAPVTPAPAETPALEAQQLRGLAIVEASYVTPPAGAPYYLIRAKTTTGAERTFRARDELVFKEAASFEGTAHLVIVRYHDDQREATAPALVLDGLEIYEGAPPTTDGGPLFR